MGPDPETADAGGAPGAGTAQAAERAGHRPGPLLDLLVLCLLRNVFLLEPDARAAALPADPLCGRRGVDGDRRRCGRNDRPRRAGGGCGPALRFHSATAGAVERRHADPDPDHNRAVNVAGRFSLQNPCAVPRDVVAAHGDRAGVPGLPAVLQAHAPAGVAVRRVLRFAREGPHAGGVRRRVAAGAVHLAATAERPRLRRVRALRPGLPELRERQSALSEDAGPPREGTGAGDAAAGIASRAASSSGRRSGDARPARPAWRSARSSTSTFR